MTTLNIEANQLITLESIETQLSKKQVVYRVSDDVLINIMQDIL